MKSILICCFAVVALTITSTFSSASFTCSTKMLIAQIAHETLTTQKSAAVQARISDAVDYALMISGLSSFAELPCYATNLTQFHLKPNNSWTEHRQCIVDPKNAGGFSCPSSSQTQQQGELLKAFETAKKGISETFSSSSNHIKEELVVGTTTSTSTGGFLSGADKLSTRSFWLVNLINLVASAHNPLSNCEFFSKADFPNGDDGGKLFNLFLGSSSSQISLETLVGNLGNLLKNVHLRHPILEFSSDEAELLNLAHSLRSELSSNITQTEKSDISISSWQNEMKNLCENVVYRNTTTNSWIQNNGKISTSYLLRLRFYLQRYVLLAGERLANLIEDLVK